MTKEEIEKRIETNKKETKKLEEELRWVELPDKIRAEFHTQFGLPAIMQSLSIESKLGKETTDKLYGELKELCEKIVGMIPKSKKDFIKLHKSK